MGLTIGQLANKAEVNVEAISYYEIIGLPQLIELGESDYLMGWAPFTGQALASIEETVGPRRRDQAEFGRIDRLKGVIL